MSLNNNKNINYKLVFLGDSAVGKTCLSNRLVNNTFFDYQEPTIGAAFLTHKIEKNGFNIKLEIWDTAGQERYRSLAPMYYRGAAGAIVVYDITCLDSFIGAKNWIKEIKSKAENCYIILVGNKCDLNHRRKVDQNLVNNYVNEESLFHILVSSKSGENIDNIFENLLDNMKNQKYIDKIIKKNINKQNLNEVDNNNYYCCRIF
jgi:small GTP-binding protein